MIFVDDCSTDETPDRLPEFDNLRVVRNPENLGFVGSCNAGAEQARGDYLVFLNNDTQVQPAWLDDLIQIFAIRPGVGRLGSRLLFPDGRQQEAGGIVFGDGSSWNYGYLDDPYKPEYSYLREPDYASGASPAIRRELFFGTHFAPAY